MLVSPSGAFNVEIDVNGASGLQNFDGGSYSSEFRHDGAVDGSVTLTITNSATGRYFVSGEIPSGYANLDTCWIALLGNVDSLPICARSESITVFAASGGGGGSAADVWNYLTSEATTTGSIGLLIASYLASLPTTVTVASPLAGNVNVQQGSYNNTLTWAIPIGETPAHDWTSATLNLRLATMPDRNHIAGTGTGTITVVSQVGAVLTVNYQTTAADTAIAQPLYAFLDAVGPGSAWMDSAPLGTITVQPVPS